MTTPIIYDLIGIGICPFNLGRGPYRKYFHAEVRRYGSQGDETARGAGSGKYPLNTYVRKSGYGA